MRYIIFFLLISLPFAAVFTQEKPKSEEETSVVEYEDVQEEKDKSDEVYWQKFPEEYTGVWKGDLEIFTAAGRVQIVPMELHILPIDDSTYTYTIIYGEDKEAGKRDYLLRAGDQGPHHWVVDEQDGILLDNFYVGGILHGPFSVMGSQLYSTLERRGVYLVYAISSGKEAPFRESGTTMGEGEEKKEVDVASFGISNFQRAFLRKGL